MSRTWIRFDASAKIVRSANGTLSLLKAAAWPRGFSLLFSRCCNSRSATYASNPPSLFILIRSAVQATSERFPTISHNCRQDTRVPLDEHSWKARIQSWNARARALSWKASCYAAASILGMLTFLE